MKEKCAFHRARVRSGLSLAGVAERVGVSKAAVSNWDRGLSFPRRDVALRLATLLQIDADELQRQPVSHHDPVEAEDIAEVFADARRRMAKVLKLPVNRIKLTLSIDA